MKNYVAYYRVSTVAQGQSGLGLESQKQIVSQFVSCKDNSCIKAEFTEIESGKKNNRIELLKAIEFCQSNKCTLVVAKLDRLSRDVQFIFSLKNSGVDFVVCDMPELNTLTLGMFATIAQHERELISSRTKAALKAKRERGEELGNVENFSDAGRAKGREIVKLKAELNLNNRLAKSYIVAIDSQGLTLRQMAEKLNTAGFRTRNGKLFTATQVMRMKS